MNAEDLRKLLRHSLAGRQVPPGARDRILGALRPRHRAWKALGAAAALGLLLAGAAIGIPRSRPLNPTIARAIEQHIQSHVFGHAAASATPTEVAQTVSEASGRDIHMPGLRDVGFTQMQAHRCESTGWAHVIYANSWLKVSCFLLDSEGLDLSGGRSLGVPGIDAHSFVKGQFSAVAVRESGLAKIWVGELRPEQLAAIACDAEQKRHQLQSTVLLMPDHGNALQLEAMLRSVSGVEDIQLEPSKQEATVKFDRRRVTVDEIMALLATNGFAASPRDWERHK